MTGFSDPQIVAMLGQHSFWARRACREVLRRPEDFIPRFLEVLDRAVNAGGDFDDIDILIPSALLLAQVREKRAYPRLAALISYDEETVDQIWGDMIHETLPYMLRDTFDGDRSLLPRIIEDQSVSVWSRITAFNAWALHYQDGHISREELTGYFRRLLEGAPQRSQENDRIFFGFLSSLICDHRLTELSGPVIALIDRNGIDRTIRGGRKEYLRDFENPADGFDNHHLDDAAGELEKWRWFEADKADEDDDDDDEGEW